jgi:hypothetical protein
VRRLLLLVAVALVAMAQPASAHGDEGLLEIVSETPDDTGSAVTYRVSLVYVSDGDPVPGATITAVAVFADQPQEPVTLDPAGDPGVYEGTVSFPSVGPWTVRFASDDPDARLQTTFRVEAPSPATTAAPPTSESGPVTSTATDPDLVDESGDSSDGPPVGLVVGLVATGVLVLVAGMVFVVQRRRRQEP